MEKGISEEGMMPRGSVFELDASPSPGLEGRKSVQLVERGMLNGEASRIDHDVRFRCLQGWFFRAAWSEKFRFLTQICDLTTELYVLEQVLKCLDSIYTKDVIDSFARDRIAFPYDVVPTDDNRSMTDQELFRARQEDTLWFLDLETSSQIDVIVKLAKLGGGGLIFSAYKEIDRIYKERREMNMVLTAVDVSIRELTEEKSGDVDINYSKRLEKSEESSHRCEHTARKKEQISKRNLELNEFRRKHGLSAVGKKRETTEVVDYIQVLPLWLNRRIMLQLNEGDLGELKRTGKYWTKMIEEAVRERNGRAAIDEKIGRSGGCRSSRPESPDEGEECPDVPVLGRDALLAELRLRQSDLLRVQKENRSEKEVKMNVSIWEEFCFEKIVCTVNESCKVLAASTSNRTIKFYSLRTGSNKGYTLTGISSNITSMAVHDEGFHVIVGCEDGSLLCMNIRKNDRQITYRGHSGPVLRIHVTDEKFVSAAEDRTVKQFELWSGLCLFCVHVDDSITSMIVLKRHSNPRCAIAGTAQGKLVFIDLGKKKIYREVVVHERKVKGVAEVGSLLVTHSADRSIRMWSVNHLEGETCGEIRPFANIRLESVATGVECLGNEIFAACADGKVRLICKLTGAAKRVVEVTQKKPIAGIYVMQEKDTTKMIMWHEGGIEMRSFSAGKAQRKKRKTKKTGEGVTAGRDAVPLSRRKFFSVVPFSGVQLTAPTRSVKRYRGTRAEDKEMVRIDRSCTGRTLRDFDADRFVCYVGDAFTQMMKKFQFLGNGELTTFSRIRDKETLPSAIETVSSDHTGRTSI